MTTVIEALYIFTADSLNSILEHIYTSRPPTSTELSTRLRSHSTPRPSILYLPDLLSPTTVYTLTHANLLLCATSSKDAPTLAVLTFLQRVIDIFEDFLGSPLIPPKIEDNYEVVAQLLTEMCDGGIVCNTEGNALREQVEISSGLGKLLTQVGLPSASPGIGPAGGLAATLKAASSSAQGPAIPWRKNNVRHTSNELYVDIVESLSIIYAPSGRPISALAQGSILFTARISGVPDLVLTLSAPGGTSTSKSAGISRTMSLPTFHPCVRLSRWKEHPGELSFIPPDGKFMLAGYESDLLPSNLDRDEPPSRSEKIFLPARVDMRTNLGRSANEFEARVTLNTNFPGMPASKPAPSSRAAPTVPFSFGSSSGSSSQPTLEAVVVTIPFPSDVRSVTELKPSRGEAHYNMSTRTVEWKIPTKDGASVSGTATLSGSVAGPFSLDNADNNPAGEAGRRSLAEYYDDDTVDAADPGTSAGKPKKGTKTPMPRSIAVSFSVKGWLMSGIKVESLMVDVKKSKGLGDGVKPYKGVKYLTVSKMGVERRVE